MTALLPSRTDGALINTLFSLVKKHGWIATANTVHVSLGYYELENDTVRKQQLESCWHYVKRSEV